MIPAGTCISLWLLYILSISAAVTAMQTETHLPALVVDSFVEAIGFLSKGMLSTQWAMQFYQST